MRSAKTILLLALEYYAMFPFMYFSRLYLKPKHYVKQLGLQFDI